MTKKFRFMTGLLAVVLAFVMLSSVAYIAAESDHDCTGVDCAICHVKGLAAFDTAHVQRTFAAFGIKVLIVDLTRAALAAPTHFFLCL